MEDLALVISQPDEGKFLQKIGWNKEQIIHAVTSITQQYEGLTYTDEQMQEAKKDRAALNSMKTALNNRRIEIKKELLAPYDAFEAEVKEVVALIEKPIAMIDEQTSAYEEHIKEEKKDELVGYFKENIGELEDVLTFDMILNPKWLNKSVSLKSCKDDITSVINKTGTDLRTIETLIEDKYRAIAKDFYFRNGRDLTKVLSEVGRMREADRKAEEERLARENAERERAEQEAMRQAEASNTPTEHEKEQKTAENASEPTKKDWENPTIEPKQEEQKPAAAVTDPFADKDTDTKIYKASFTIRGTKAQILAVKEFMINNNIQFGKVEK